MKKGLIALLLFAFIVVLSGCDKDNKNDSLHESKMTYVALNTDNELTLLKSAPLFYGERQLKYYFLSPGENIAFFREMSGSENFLYNFSYLVNVPAKLYRNIQFDLNIDKEIGEKIVQSSNLDKAIKAVSSWYLIFRDVLSALIGILLSVIMIIIGTLLGLILHPIKSVTTFIPSVIGLVTTLYHAVSNFFGW